MFRQKSLFSVVALLGITQTVACGSSHHKGKTGSDAGSGTVAPSGNGDAGSNPAAGADGPWISRGRWTMAVSSQGEASGASALTATDDNQPVSATIAAGVVFTVSNTSFKPPAPTGVASYGSLLVTALSDNNLNVCGAAGTSACTGATIVIYTSGATGAGLWNTVGGYGAPITTSGHTVGLNVGGADVLGSVALTATNHVVSLSQFTAGATLAIPISIDFTNAGAGSYATNLVVEYGLH